MRALLFLIFTFPAFCHVSRADSCWPEGKINGKKVILDFIDMNTGTGVSSAGLDTSYGLSGSPLYGYCTVGSKDENVSHYMSCASKRGGQETVYYEQSQLDGYIYTCKTGCSGNVVKEFKFECDVGD